MLDDRDLRAVLGVLSMAENEDTALFHLRVLCRQARVSAIQEAIGVCDRRRVILEAEQRGMSGAYLQMEDMGHTATRADEAQRCARLIQELLLNA